MYDNFNKYKDKYDLKEEEYKNEILDVIKTTDPELKLIAVMHAAYKYHHNTSNSSKTIKTLYKEILSLNENDVLIKDSDIWPKIKEKFINDT